MVVIGFQYKLGFKIFLLEELKLEFLNLADMKTNYIRFYEVLPGMSQEKFDKHMEKSKKISKRVIIMSKRYSGKSQKDRSFMKKVS